MAPNLKIKVLEQSQVSPPRDTIPELSIPLSFFDIPWIEYHHMQFLLFFALPHSKTEVLEAIIPDLKASFSLTLKHFLPIAGNLVLPFNSGMPELNYTAGDSVTLVIAESDYDFNFLKGNHPRKADDFHPLFLKLPRFANLAPPHDSHCLKIPVLAMQVTIFQDVGITIGATFNHVLGDGRILVAFTEAWTSIHRLGEKGIRADLLSENFLQCFDRSLINDPGERLANGFWSKILKGRNMQCFSNQPGGQEDDDNVDSDKVRVTYVVTLEHIEKMKNFALKKMPELLRISSFTVICAYVWTCLVKSGAAIGEKVDMNETEYFNFPADCRALLNPPLPDNYFGNCLVPLTAKIVHAQLTENDGFVNACVSIGKAVDKLMNNQGGSLDLDFFISEYQKRNPLHSFGVSGSLKLNGYEADFGWGKMQKFEFVSIDHDGVMSLVNRAGKSDTSLEVGLSMSKIKTEAFDTFFNEGLRIM